MTADQELIMKTVNKVACSYQEVRPAGYDTLIFKAGAKKVTVKYILAIDLYQVLTYINGAHKITMGVHPHQLAEYFA